MDNNKMNELDLDPVSGGNMITSDNIVETNPEGKLLWVFRFLHPNGIGWRVVDATHQDAAREEATRWCNQRNLPLIEVYQTNKTFINQK